MKESMSPCHSGHLFAQGWKVCGKINNGQVLATLPDLLSILTLTPLVSPFVLYRTPIHLLVGLFSSVHDAGEVEDLHMVARGLVLFPSSAFFG
jgi:hypothetical protein